ncbi:MAG: Gldg family protein, partial [Acidobacteria bacterium]|nr:Gldg family protein [Acidobacteriota bacterium]
MANWMNRQEWIKTAGYVGAALLVSGYFRYNVQESMTPLNKGFLIGGGVLMAVSIGFSYRQILAFSRRRSTRLGANTSVMTVALLILFGAANFLGYRHHKRVDLTAEKLYSLSDQSRKIAAGLQKDVKVIRFQNEEDEDLRDLMAEYRDVSKRISYERVDPQVRIEMARQYN